MLLHVFVTVCYAVCGTARHNRHLVWLTPLWVHALYDFFLPFFFYPGVSFPAAFYRWRLSCIVMSWLSSFVRFSISQRPSVTSQNAYQSVHPLKKLQEWLEKCFHKWIHHQQLPFLFCFFISWLRLFWGGGYSTKYWWQIHISLQWVRWYFLYSMEDFRSVVYEGWD